MKKIIYQLIAAAMLTSCGQPDSYKVTVTLPVEDMNNETVYLIDLGRNDTLATTQIVDCKFEFAGEILKPAIFRLGTNSGFGLSIPAEAGETSISDNNGEAEIKGGALTQEFVRIEDQIKELGSKFSDFYRSHKADREAIMQEQSKYIANRNDIYLSAMNANKDNILGAYYLGEFLFHEESSIAKIDSLVSEIDLAADFLPITETRNRLLAFDATAAGAKFVDFEGTTIDGSKSSLSDYVAKGNYVLVDFWASWCGPCKAEIPNLKEVYELYKDKGLVVLGVNVWDKHNLFVEAVAEEGMTWSQIYASHDRKATDSYGIKGIPTIILFAPDGTIVDRTLRGSQIKQKLSEIY